MLICVDIGNTNIVIGIYQESRLLNTYRLETKIFRTSDEYGHKLLDNLHYLHIAKDEIDGAVIASVVPEIDGIMEETFHRYFSIKPLFVNSALSLGIDIKIDQPNQLGADLFVGAYAAVKKYGAPCIIVDMGTASTLVAVNSQKAILGAIIIPGVMESYSALIKATSLLESAKLQVPKKVIGTDTISALQSGMIYGTACNINGLIALMKEEMAELNPMVTIVTGGIAKYIVPHLKDVIYDENLLMEGLKEIYFEKCK